MRTAPSTALVRVRVNHDQIERLDDLAAKLGADIERRVSRAALVRALINLGLTVAAAPEIVDVIKTDTVRPGAPRGKPRPRRR